MKHFEVVLFSEVSKSKKKGAAAALASCRAVMAGSEIEGLRHVSGSADYCRDMAVRAAGRALNFARNGGSEPMRLSFADDALIVAPGQEYAAATWGD